MKRYSVLVVTLLSWALMIVAGYFFLRGARSHDEEYSLLLIIIGTVMGIWATLIALIKSR